MVPSWQFLPVAAGLFLWVLPLVAEPDPGFVDAMGRKTNRAGESLQYLLPDPAATSSPSRGKALIAPTRLRPIEPFRTVRELLPDGRILMQTGRPIALLGCIPDSTSTLEARIAWTQRAGLLKGKIVRLLFEAETRNNKGDLAAYVFLSDGRLLNEVLLAEGLSRLDTRARLSAQYALRFRDAENEARRATRGIWARERPTKANAAAPTVHPELPQHPRGFAGISAGRAALGGEERAGKNQSP